MSTTTKLILAIAALLLCSVVAIFGVTHIIDSVSEDKTPFSQSQPQSPEDKFIEAYDAKVTENGREDLTSEHHDRDDIIAAAESFCEVFDRHGVNDPSVNYIVETSESKNLPAEGWAPLVTGATQFLCPEHEADLRAWMNQ